MQSNFWTASKHLDQVQPNPSSHSRTNLRKVLLFDENMAVGKSKYLVTLYLLNLSNLQIA